MRIELRDVWKKYKNREKIDYGSMEFFPDKINVIRGNNGSGKTTLLNIIAGLDDEYGGMVRYDGKKINRDIANNITLVNQKPYLFKKTVYDNIAYPLKLRSASKDEIEEKINRLASKLDIGRLLCKRADQLSGGETQKVSLARGIIFSPRVLLLDEFTSGIDSSMLRKMEDMICEYRSTTGANVIIISHSKEQIERLGDTILDLSAQEV